VTTYVALLRAINLGAVNRVLMAPLKQAFVGAGYEDAFTHIQSGNVIFSSSDSAADAKARVEKLITDEFGLRITVIIRTAKQLAAVTKANPFLASTKDPTALYVAFLETTPDKKAVAAFGELTYGDAEFVVHRQQVFLRYSHGLGTSKLSNAVIEKKLGAASTIRNWNVTTKLAELAAAHTP
jgi:uncharacterized protein (DUF1697 family)